MAEKHITSIGGQAVIEGVMMRGPFKPATCVRKPDGEIECKIDENGTKKDNNFLKLPIIRGCVNFVSSLVIGMKALMFSAEFVDIEGEEETEEVEESAESAAIASAETVTELQNLHKKVVELLNVVNDADRSTVITEFEAIFAEFPIEEAMDTVEELGNAIQQENLTEAEAKELKETLETMAESGDQMIGILLATGATIEKVPDDLLVSEGTFDELLEMGMDLGLLLDGMIIAYGETDGSGDFELTEKSYEKMGDLATVDQTLREVSETLSRFTPENISETGAVWMIETFSPMIDELNGLLDGE
mgnify:CR=1 FL=1